MTKSDLLAENLPYLRRFARALTGTQKSGDAYAIATLEAITADPHLPSDSDAAKIYLFTVFHKIWASMPLNHRDTRADAATTIAAADRSLESITPMLRVTFLLRAVENFTTAEISEIMAIPETEVAELLDKASLELASQLSTDVLIIEDERIIAMDLQALVEDLGHRVTRIARTHRDAVAAIAAQVPGLVLADIQLADGSSGLEAVTEILKKITVPVIFITAYPERLLTGVRPEPTFLITKPFRRETVMAIISQALFFDHRASIAGQ